MLLRAGSLMDLAKEYKNIMNSVSLGGLRTKNIVKRSISGQSLITIITVVFNGEKELEETILSVINQTYKNLEYIIIDGASTDGTLEIVKKYDENIDYWVSEPDDGIYDAMNKGTKLASGEWVNFMNSGDLFYGNKIVNTINSFINDDIDLIYGDVLLDDGKIYRMPKKIGQFYFLMEHMICHQSIFVRQKYLKLYPFNIKYNICADRDWLHKIIDKGAVIRYIPVTICKYDRSGISSNRENSLYDSMALIKDMFGLFGFFFVVIKRAVRVILKGKYK
jgi:glycosyltransferase involved in cell wall biosynthesis